MSILVYHIFMVILVLGQTFGMLCSFAYSESAISVLPLLSVNCVLEKVLSRKRKERQRQEKEGRKYAIEHGIPLLDPVLKNFMKRLMASKKVMLSDMTLMDFQRISAVKSGAQWL